MGRHRSGRQHRIAGYGYEAEIASVGASLRSLTFEKRDLVVPFGVTQERPAMRGALLAPWPNRLADGRYRLRDRDYSLPLTEAARRNAIHGLAAGLDFELVGEGPATVSLGALIEPRPGYPWAIAITVDVAVAADGLTHTVTARNTSATSAPFGVGVHPYLLAGAAAPRAADGWSLEVPADDVLLVTPDRLLPDRIVPVATHADGAFDLRTARVLGQRRLNHAFTALHRGPDGLSRVRLTEPSGRGVELLLGQGYGWVHVYTSDEVDDDRPRAGVAIEPMTCPPDAFNSGRDLALLAPGEGLRASFHLRGVAPA
ncbi:aldose 1-epimerase family protein [Demequina lignilytica]|uniref:Aldose 1-epimerase family protein n=1 Tax=Demequina lignilytica TaxID=3051663 RepID=A0AB35MER6_9MICO|nr:aldose 1-epimerase family protein [Demequina sp. SYSU T0a273]MDN4482257.1 aldose 1-epimerase family protein [Demequina sp. SYSU T0a273]